jgi:hypothetical protein
VGERRADEIVVEVGGVPAAEVVAHPVRAEDVRGRAEPPQRLKGGGPGGRGPAPAAGYSHHLLAGQLRRDERLDRDHPDDAVVLDREVPGLAERHPRPVHEMDDLIAVRVDDGILHLAGQHDVDLLRPVAEAEHVLALDQMPRCHLGGQRLKLRAREILEQIRPGQPRQHIRRALHAHQSAPRRNRAPRAPRGLPNTLAITGQERDWQENMAPAVASDPQGAMFSIIQRAG